MKSGDIMENDSNLFETQQIPVQDEEPVAENENQIPEEIPVIVQPQIPSQDDKGNLKKIFITACVVCALVGGIAGGIVSGTIIKNKVEKLMSALSQYEVHTQSQENSYIPETTVTVPETTTNPETTTKTETTTAQTTTQKTEITTKAQNSSAIKSGTYTSNSDKPSLTFTFSGKEIYKYNVESVVSIEVRNGRTLGYGTGFIISEKGYIVTNYHVVEGANEFIVTLYDETRYEAIIVGYEESNDLAIIKIEPKGEIQSVVYGKSSDLSVGDNVYVIGNPLGDLTFTLTSGVVSALNRLIDTGSGFTINMFQTDAAINSGNSGGPVFDEHGFVVGIASAKYASSSIEGLGFCVPIDDVRSMIDEIINNGYVSGKPLMGISVYDKEITNFGFIQSSRSINGAKIAAIGSNSAGAKAGLQVGDIIVAADGKEVKNVSQLRTILSDYRCGNAIVLTVNRNETQLTVTLVFDEYTPSLPRTQYSNVYDL